MSSATTAESPKLGETLRRRRLQRGLAIAEVAAELGIPSKRLRAIEWDRRDLIGSPFDADVVELKYAAFLDQGIGRPTAQAAKAAPRVRDRRRARAVWIALLAGLASMPAIALVYVLEETTAVGGGEIERRDLTQRNMQLLALGLVLLASLLLLIAVLPTGVVERVRVAPARFQRYRQPLALAAVGILAAVALFALLVAVT
jgi:transcriptional regulator with XRE-family HTH domain